MRAARGRDAEGEELGDRIGDQQLSAVASTATSKLRSSTSEPYAGEEDA